jgi:hypothetical protein
MRPNSGWTTVSELTVIAQTADGSLARYPLLTVEYTWRFREFSEKFAAEFGMPLQVIRLIRDTRHMLRQQGWKHPGEFANADRPRKLAAGRIAVSTGSLPFFGPVMLCKPEPVDASPAAAK